MFVFFFFFSSRRRHTRCGRDWSSDVCSSDLLISSYEWAMTTTILITKPKIANQIPPITILRPRVCTRLPAQLAAKDDNRRSEERRVGKECRSRWAADHEKKNKKKKNEERDVN